MCELCVERMKDTEQKKHKQRKILEREDARSKYG